MAPDPAAMKRRRWWIAGATIGGMLLVFVTVFFLWLFSTADLDAVDARARSLGLPANFDEAKLPLSPPEDVAKWDAVVAALAKCPRWKPNDRTEWYGPSVGEPIPDGALKHLVAQKAQLKTLFSAVDDLPETGVWLRDGAGFDQSHQGLSHYFLIQVLAQALVLPGTEAEMAERLLRPACIAPSCYPSHHGFQHRISMMRMAISPLFSVEFTGSERALLVRESDKLMSCLAAWPWYRSEYLRQRAWLSALGLNGDSLCQTLSMKRYPGDWLIATMDLRIHRSMYLEKIQDISMDIRVRPMIDTYIRAIASCDSRGPLKYSRLRDIALWDSIVFAIHKQLVLQMKLAVLHSELTGEPWPVDPFDAKGGSVRQLIKDGQLIGVYSIGINQIDDHGDQNLDKVLKLRPRPAPVDAKPPGGR